MSNVGMPQPQKTALALAVGCALLGACTEASTPVTESPGEQIEAYLQSSGLTDQEATTSTGLVYVIEEPGGAEHPTLGDDITIHYKGYTQSGGTFDETDGSPRTFPLRNLIPAWQEGIPLIGRGGKIKLYAPPALAYGPNPPGGIPPGAVLAFDVELVDF